MKAVSDMKTTIKTSLRVPMVMRQVYALNDVWCHFSGLGWQSRPKVYEQDGLRSLKYRIHETKLKPLYTWIYAELSTLHGLSCMHFTRRVFYVFIKTLFIYFNLIIYIFIIYFDICLTILVMIIIIAHMLPFYNDSSLRASKRAGPGYMALYTF